MKNAKKKLRKQCELLSYQVQKLELEQRIAELQQSDSQEPLGFSPRKKGGRGNENA